MASYAILLALITACVFTTAGWWLDQWVLACGTTWRAMPASALLAIGSGVVILITASRWLEVPGAYGPVQYWGEEGISFMMRTRASTLFVMLFGMLLSVTTALLTVASLFYEARRSRFSRLVLPTLAEATFILAHYIFMEYEFFPSA